MYMGKWGWWDHMDKGTTISVNCLLQYWSVSQFPILYRNRWIVIKWVPLCLPPPIGTCCCSFSFWRIRDFLQRITTACPNSCEFISSHVDNLAPRCHSLSSPCLQFELNLFRTMVRRKITLRRLRLAPISTSKFRSYSLHLQASAWRRWLKLERKNQTIFKYQTRMNNCHSDCRWER